MSLRHIGLAVASLALPVVAFAISPIALPPSGGGVTLGSLLTQFAGWINALVPFIIGLAVLLFLFGVVKYILAQDNEEGRKSARQLMLWGIIMLFVMVSVWGLVRVLTTSFGLESDTALPGPGLQTVPGV